MKIMDQEQPWPNKVNFVDENNVCVGYDMDQYCCENAGWFIADEIVRDNIRTGDHPNVDEYCFDRSFFDEYNLTDEYDCGVALFKLISANKPDLYLHLFNSHNGYYSHGFSMSVGNDVVHDGEL